MGELFDVVIIGAGIAGAATARELSRFDLSVAILEKEADVCFGTTKATHGIVHCGVPGNKFTPLRNRGELRGNLIMGEVCKQLGVEFEKTGKLLVAFDQSEIEVLRKTEHAARQNGAVDIELITDCSRLKDMEPNMSEDIVGALYTPRTAVASPWELVFGFVENAQANGVEVFVNAEVNEISEENGILLIQSTVGPFKARLVINASGANADEVAGLVGDHTFTIEGTRQQRIVMDKTCRDVVRHVVRGLNAKGAVGDFVCPTVYGDILVGSVVEPMNDKTDVKTTREGVEERLLPGYKKLVPSLDSVNCIKTFAGFIPKASGPNLKGDYYIAPAPNCPQFVNMVLGGSGFTSALAMAEYIVLEVLPRQGLNLQQKRAFDPIRYSIPKFSKMTNEERALQIQRDPLYGHIICRCETVSEGEIIESIRRGATTVDGVKFRTRAGMGRCQGGFCRPRIMKVLSRELDKPVQKITRKGRDSVEVKYPAKELLNRTTVQEEQNECLSKKKSS